MEAIYQRMLMSRSPQERFKMGLQMCASARAAVMASLPADLSPADRKIAVLRRYYSEDFTAEALLRIETALRARWATAENPE